MTWLVRLVLALAAHGVLLMIAALLLDKFNLTFVGWIIGTVLFTVFTMLLRGVMTALARKYVSAATFLGGVALVWVGLLLTELVTSSAQFSIEGVGTWIYATLIVWLGTVIYGLVDDRLIAAVSNRGSNPPAQ
ncbi:hypothetical protein [Haloactinopolyspora sp.]|uniref:hypothetical protein n=1 Tax=Haloactinopolyspora sp. TaxID=1966353 RepID=UPI002615B86B|nr:hypothetical protein [Haloactinopolyspora sp.]